MAFAARYALETLKLSADVDSEIVFCGGGGFRSPIWNQIRADVLNVPLRIMSAAEPGISGAVTLAAIGSGVYSDFSEASHAIAKFSSPLQPTPKQAELYNCAFDVYRDAIQANSLIGKRLTNLHGFSKLKVERARMNSLLKCANDNWEKFNENRN